MVGGRSGSGIRVSGWDLMVRRRSRSCGYEWVLQVRILEVPRQVVRYESSSAKLNRLGRMQVRNKAKSTPREQEDDEEAAGGGAGREGVREIGEERAGAGGGGTNQPLADKKQGKNLAGLISSLLLLLPLNRPLSLCVRLCPSLSLSPDLLSVCNLSLLPCQARVKTKTRLGLWLGRLVQGSQGYQMPIF